MNPKLECTTCGEKPNTLHVIGNMQFCDKHYRVVVNWVARKFNAIKYPIEGD